LELRRVAAANDYKNDLGGVRFHMSCDSSGPVIFPVRGNASVFFLHLPGVLCKYGRQSKVSNHARGRLPNGHIPRILEALINLKLFPSWEKLTGLSLMTGNLDKPHKHNLLMNIEGVDFMRNMVETTACTDDSLVDIRTVSVDRTLPREARIIEFVRQIKNPYRYKCGKFTITTKYAETGLTLEECLLQMMN
jgi:hypothetical protein